jgi:hypothetical protein
MICCYNPETTDIERGIRDLLVMSNSLLPARVIAATTKSNAILIELVYLCFMVGCKV